MNKKLATSLAIGIFMATLAAPQKTHANEPQTLAWFPMETVQTAETAQPAQTTTSQQTQPTPTETPQTIDQWNAAFWQFQQRLIADFAIRLGADVAQSLNFIADTILLNGQPIDVNLLSADLRQEHQYLRALRAEITQSHLQIPVWNEIGLRAFLDETNESIFELLLHSPKPVIRFREPVTTDANTPVARDNISAIQIETYIPKSFLSTFLQTADGGVAMTGPRLIVNSDGVGWDHYIYDTGASLWIRGFEGILTTYEFIERLHADVREGLNASFWRGFESNRTQHDELNAVHQRFTLP